MSNKYLLPLVTAILISTVIAVSVNQYFKPDNAKVAIVSSSSFVTGVSSKLTTSSSSIQAQSSSSSVVIASEVKVVESIVAKPKAVKSNVAEVKTVSNLPISPTTNKKCEIEESETRFKVQTGDLCFGVIRWYEVEGFSPKEPNYENVIGLQKSIVEDFYKRVSELGVSTDSSSSVVISWYEIISENEFKIHLSYNDEVRYRKENPNAYDRGGPLGYNAAQYKITKDANNKWNWKLISIAEK